MMHDQAFKENISIYIYIRLVKFERIFKGFSIVFNIFFPLKQELTLTLLR